MEGKETSLSSLDCTVVYYIKQLSPSDAASSKQIKLPKTEARRFCGDLRHKQRSMVTVLDHQHVCWEFLCTCYGCQYALSRVAVFCNTYQLRAGQYLLFYRDSKRRLRIAVTGSIPPNLLQQVSSGGHHLKRSYSQMAAAHPVPTDDYAAPAVAATDACTVQQQQPQQQWQQHSPGAAVDAIRQSSRDQMCMQKEVKQPQLISQQADAFQQHQHHQQQFNLPHACYSEQQQRMSPVAEAAALHAAAEVHVCEQQQQQQQGSQNSSDSSSSRQLLSVCPETQVLRGGGLGSGSSLTPTSTAAGGLTGAPAWNQLITQQQQQQQQGKAALPGSSAAAAAATRLPATVAAENIAAAAAAAAAGAACIGTNQHAKGIEMPDDTAAAAVAAAAAKASVAPTAIASKASNSPGSCLVCHEQLLDSPSAAAAAAAAAASEPLVKARAKQRSSSQTERLKLKWRVANSSAAHSNAAAAAVSSSCHAVASSGCLPGSNSSEGVEQKMLALPKNAAGPHASTTARQCATVPKQFTHKQSYTLGSSSKLLAMHVDNSGRRLEHNSNGRNNITCNRGTAGSSTNSTSRAQHAVLPKIHFKQQRQQLLGCASTVTPHPLTDAGGAQYAFELLNQQTSQQLPGWGPDKQYVGQGAPGWGPDKQYTSSRAPLTVLPTAAELPLHLGLHPSVTGSNTTHNAAAQAAAAAVGGSISSTAQSAETQNTVGRGLLLSTNSQWQLHLSGSSSSGAGFAADESASKRLRCGAPEHKGKMVPSLQQPNIAAGVAQDQNRLLSASADEFVALHASQLTYAYSGQQQQQQQRQPCLTAMKHSGKGSHTLASSNLKVPQLRVPHGFGKISSSGSSNAAAMQQSLNQLQQRPRHAARSNRMWSAQLLPLFQSGPRLSFPAAASAGLQGRGMRAAATGNARLAHAQQQQFAFEADEWSAVSSLLMLAQRDC